MTIHGYLSATVNEQGKEKQLALWKHNLLTNGGRDAFHALCYTNTAAGTRGFGYVASTQSSFSPAATDTTLIGEITTNGLARSDATTKSHTGGTNSSTVEHTFTATGSFTDVLASATFRAGSAGTMGHEANFTTDRECHGRCARGRQERAHGNRQGLAAIRGNHAH